MSKKVQTEVEGHRLELSNLDKVLYPETGFTKGQVIDYYTRISPVMLPHIEGRPVTMKRYPDGVNGESFFEKQCPAYHPDWMETATVESRNERGEVSYCLVDSVADLVWLANLAALEMHTLLARADDIDRPTFVAFDMDPGPPAGVLDAAWGALQLREVLGEAGLECFCKVSGGKGVHVYAPLNTPVEYAATKEFAHSVARLLEKRYPERVTSVMRKALRKGKVFIDWSQNDPHKTTVCAYSLRAREHPYVSTPVTWDELEAARKGKKAGALKFETGDTLERAEDGDLFAPVLSLKQELPDFSL